MRSKTTLSIAAAGFFACMVFLVFSATFKTEPAPAQVPEVTIRAGGAPDERDIDLLVGDTGTQAPGTLRVSNGSPPSAMCRQCSSALRVMTGIAADMSRARIAAASRSIRTNSS